MSPAPLRRLQPAFQPITDPAFEIDHGRQDRRINGDRNGVLQIARERRPIDPFLLDGSLDLGTLEGQWALGDLCGRLILGGRR